MSRLDASGLFYTDIFGRDERLTGLLLVVNSCPFQTQIDGVDRFVLAIYDEMPPGLPEAEHWMWEETRIQVRRITAEGLNSYLASGDHRGIVQWLVHGNVLIDRRGFLETTRRRLSDWPVELKEQKLLCEFSRFIRSFLQAKQDLKDGQIMDAYSNILASLHHWAHIALIEEGMLPELTVWEQVRKVNPGIYKLYEELTASPETPEQRVHLLLLACEFNVLAKMKSSCALLIRLISSRHESWGISELQRHPELTGLPLELSLVLHKLANRGYIREIAKPLREMGIGLLELRYAAVSGE